MGHSNGISSWDRIVGLVHGDRLVGLVHGTG